MKLADYIVLGLILSYCLFLILRRLILRKKNKGFSGCLGDCSRCSGCGGGKGKRIG